MRSISVAIAAILILFAALADAGNQKQEPAKPQAEEKKPPAEQAKPAATEPKAPPAPTGPKTYVGSEACQACHEDIFNAFQKDPHKAVDFDKKRGRENNACEGCHGPASSHVETASAEEIINPAKLPAARVDETCLACHRNQPTHMGRIQSGHARSRVACTSCHRMHKPEPASLVARKPRDVNQQCASCHPGVWAAFQRPHAHRLPQAAMSCSDCHNPHGSFLLKQVRTFAANEPGCFTCHANLRGPFTYEHSPMRTEGCQTCHEVHGSANPKMLTRAEVRFVCLECHSNLPQQTSGVASVIGVVPPAFHDLRSPRFRNCTVCHQKVHGSHVDRHLTR
jgi:DmsE family decaheme c-type cytochrome